MPAHSRGGMAAATLFEPGNTAPCCDSKDGPFTERMLPHLEGSVSPVDGLVRQFIGSPFHLALIDASKKEYIGEFMTALTAVIILVWLHCMLARQIFGVVRVILYHDLPPWSIPLQVRIQVRISP